MRAGGDVDRQGHRCRAHHRRQGLVQSDHAVSETRASRSTMDAIEASSKETLPAWLDFKVIPFEGLG